MSNPLIKGIEENEKKWHEHTACERINALESYCQNHGWNGYFGETVPDFLRSSSISLLQALIGEMEGKKKDYKGTGGGCPFPCELEGYDQCIIDTIATLKETLLALEAKG